MKLGLREIFVLVLVASGLNLLDGELFYLSLVRGETGIEEISWLFKSSLSSYVGLTGNWFSSFLFHFFHESGVFAIYFLALSLGSLFYLKFLEKLTGNNTLSIILAAFGIIGVASKIHDLNTSLAFFLGGLQLLLLINPKRGTTPISIILSLLLIFIDASFLLPISFYFLLQRTTINYLLALLLVFNSFFLIVKGGFSSAYSDSVLVLSAFLGIAIAATSKSPKLMLLSVFIPALYIAWEKLLDQRFPAGNFYAPLIAGYIWSNTPGTSKERFLEFFSKLESSFSGFFTLKNKLAFTWLCLTFIFFQSATKLYHPVNEAYLPKETMDVLTELRPSSPPLHSATIGGYVAYRLAPLIKVDAKLNYLDSSASFFSDLKIVNDYEKIFLGQNEEFFRNLDPKIVLCQGRDGLCQSLKTNSQWKEIHHSSLEGRILERLGKIPERQKEILIKRLEEESWYLFGLMENHSIVKYM